jgi:UDPglucose 6-dehydrogenase
MTEWDQFKTLNYEKIYAQMLKPAFVFDGRRIIDKAALDRIGFKTYKLGE